MANKLLGEIEVKINENTFVLKPSFDGLVEMEDRAGCTIAVLVNKIILGQAGIKDVTAIIYGGIVGAGAKNKKEVTFQQLGMEIVAHGMSKLLVECGQLVGAGYTGKPIDEIDAESVSKKKEQDKEL